jgi:D-3-phosphoglycerate dehydrogenase
MYHILTFNQISLKGLEKLPRERYEVSSKIGEPDAILLRSHQLDPSALVPSLKAIARAGAGVNNIPVDLCTERGIPVFNTPGANANAVKELVLATLFLCSRGVLEGIHFIKNLKDPLEEKALEALLEKEKKQFSGEELLGKTLGIVGLGAIGSLVAETALQLGMRVLGYDPAISVDAAWKLSRDIQKMENLHSLLAHSDYVTLHLPVLETTKNLINKDTLKALRPHARLLNFARGQIVEDVAVALALKENRLGRYATDFPTPQLLQCPKVILFPHMGASTVEAEENCAILAAEQIKNFLENGNIKNSVNFPSLYLERSSTYRIALANRNVSGLLGSVLSVLAEQKINVADMLNKSKDKVAYNLIDIETEPTAALLEVLRKIPDVINVRSI